MVEIGARTRTQQTGLTRAPLKKQDMPFAMQLHAFPLSRQHFPPSFLHEQKRCLVYEPSHQAVHVRKTQHARAHALV